MKKTILYQKTRLGKIQQWTTWVKEKGDSGFPEVWVEFGQVDGKKQTTFDTIKFGMNVGKINETTPVVQAILETERAITKQKEEGYCDTIKEAEQVLLVDFDAPMPKQLCFYKPKNSIDESKLAKLEKAKKTIYTVKRDGMCHIIRKTKKFGIEIYSRRMDLVTEKYPHLVNAFSDLPDNVILLGEIILNKDGRDNFNAVSKICRSDKDKAIERQKEFGNVSYYIFDYAFENGLCLLTSKSYSARLEKIKSLTNKLNSKYVIAVETINKSHEAAMKEIKERKLEGLVVWDTDGVMDSGAAFTFNGKAYRPNVVWKSKPLFEDDFIARWNPDENIGDFGKGKNKNKLGNVFLYQLDDEGNEVYIGKCGGGLSDEQRIFYTDVSLFPRTWKIEFSAVQNKTGSLRFPVFNADRTLIGDKEMSECVMSDMIKAAREQEPEEDEDTEE